jgi:hypothetical protein
MLYTALSRAKRIDQIRLIVHDKGTMLDPEILTPIDPSDIIYGSVYKISCLTTQEVYYGSTVLTVPERLKLHQSEHSGCTSYIIIQRQNYICETIGRLSCNNKKDLKRMLEEQERYLILNNPCVNRVAPHSSGWRRVTQPDSLI